MSTRDEALAVALEQIEKQFSKKSAPIQLKQHVASFTDGEGRTASMYFGRGSFDDWCIHLKGNHSFERFPTDNATLATLDKWKQHRSAEDIYQDFCTIYDRVTAHATYEYTREVIAHIEELAFKYPDYFEACVIWTFFYMGMIAEENKANAILKKRIKRLGVYQVLIEGVSPKIAAHYSRGQSADYLDKVCYYRGF
jgi:hypothetical protein